eukprot:14989657-Alexandrium_andersonii.AAC.1
MVAPATHKPPASWVQVVESHLVHFDPDADAEESHHSDQHLSEGEPELQPAAHGPARLLDPTPEQRAQHELTHMPFQAPAASHQSNGGVEAYRRCHAGLARTLLGTITV